MAKCTRKIQDTYSNCEMSGIVKKPGEKDEVHECLFCTVCRTVPDSTKAWKWCRELSEFLRRNFEDQLGRQGSGDSEQSEGRGAHAGVSNRPQSFTTTVSAALSASAQPLAIDGTTAVMDEEILKALRCHDASHSLPRTSGWQQEEEDPPVDSQERLVRQRLNTMWSAHETALLCQLLDSGGLSPSWAETILPIVHTVTEIIRPDVKNDSDDMDIRQYIQFKKVPGGSRSECQILNGVVCTKNVADKSMLVRLSDPQLLLVASTIDYQRGNDNKLLTLDNLLLQEADYLKNVVAKIVSYKPNIILVEKSIAFLAREYLQAHGITLVMNVKPSVMERVARCTQAELVSSIDAQLKKPILGLCHSFYVRSYPMPGKDKTKTLMFFDGCATHLGCTVILRGATNSELKRVKRIMYFMIYATYNWKLERSFLMDEYAFIPPLPSESFDLEDQVFVDAQSPEEESVPKEIKDIMDNTITAEDVEDVSVGSAAEQPCREKVTKQGGLVRDTANSSMESSTSTPGPLDKTKLSQTINDFSDPLHSYLNSGASPQEPSKELLAAKLQLTELPFSNTFRKALDDTILSCSPYLKYSVPYLESDASRNCLLRRFFQKNLYFSIQLEKEKLVRRPRFSEMDAKDSNKDENQNVRVKPAHKFMNFKVTEEAKTPVIQNILADFRARGGQMELVCRCKNKNHRECSLERNELSHQVIIEGLPDSSGFTNGSNKNSFYDHWNGPGGLMLTSEGRVDSLHPFNHQRLSVLFSSFTDVTDPPPDFCVNPWVLTMDFYGRNDIPLGAFLERYCFSLTYMCPSTECSKGLVNHIRKFVHDTGCVDVLLRCLDTVLDDSNAGTILMWSWCKNCRQVTPVVPMSLETWSLSFAKYLELRFYGSSFSRRGLPGCSHSMHHDHFQYFGYKKQVAIFKYNPVTVREIMLPPSEMSLCIPPVTQSMVVEQIKGVAIQVIENGAQSRAVEEVDYKENIRRECWPLFVP